MTSDCELWPPALRAAGRSPRAIDNSRSFERFDRFFGPDLLDATRLDVLRWVQEMQETLAPASVSHHARGLRPFDGCDPAVVNLHRWMRARHHDPALRAHPSLR